MSNPPRRRHRTGADRAADLATSTARVAERLWIGGAHALLPHQVTVVVTLDDTAPPITAYGLTETRAPFPDSRWQPVDTHAVATALRDANRTDRDVLIRCRHGCNRSALIAALLLRSRGLDPQQAIGMIRRARPGALTNPYFVDLIHEWPHDPMRRSAAVTQGAPARGSTLTPDNGGTPC